jgi:hypothetical protein
MKAKKNPANHLPNEPECGILTPVIQAHKQNKTNNGN